MRYRWPFALVISLGFLALGPAATDARAQSSSFCSTGTCRPAASPFALMLVGCQSCDGCGARPAPVVNGLEGAEPESAPSVGDLSLNETFAAFTGSTFAVSAPNMIGDNLGAPRIPIYVADFDSNGYGYRLIEVGSGAGGAVVGRIKLSDNNSPIPRDRLLLDYNYFHNARLIEGGKDVNRLTPGFEKTFLDGLASFEMRVPLLATLDSDLTFNDAGNPINPHGTEMGNLSMILKGLLWYNSSLAIAGGMGITVPTANDVRLSDSQGNGQLTIQNDAVFLTPYIAFLSTPSDNFFYQGFLGVDIAANGNRIYGAQLRGPSQELGRFNDQTMLMVDLGAGSWLLRNPSARGLTGLAAVVEMHYNQMVDSMDVVASDQVIVGAAEGQSAKRGFVNMTVGGTALFNERTMFTLGYGTPISSDKLFDGELRAFLNRFF